MPEYKKQHYVPQFLQRMFSIDGANIACYHLNRNEQYLASIVHNAQKDWFYKINEDDKISIERTYGEIETDAGPLVARINNSDFCLSSEETETLFVFSQVKSLSSRPKCP